MTSRPMRSTASGLLWTGGADGEVLTVACGAAFGEGRCARAPPQALTKAVDNSEMNPTTCPGCLPMLIRGALYVPTESATDRR
jgi:hypothetical protein